MAHPTVLEDLLSPLTIQELATRYFGREAIHVRGGAEKLARVYSLTRFRDLLRAAAPEAVERKRSHGRAMVTRAVYDRRWANGTVPQLVIDGPQAEAAYASGATICVASLDRMEDDLALLCNQAKAQLGFAGEVAVNAYWSPDGCGFGQHFDGRVVTTLQLEGKKKWRFSRFAAVEWPSDNANEKGGEIAYRIPRERDDWEHDARVMQPEDWREVVLEPGDVLCLPAGAWHSAEADGSSFALNLNFNPMPIGAFLGELLDIELMHDARHRCVSPLFGERGVFTGIGGNAARAVTEQLDAVIALLMEWREDPRRLARAWANVAGQEQTAPPMARTELTTETPLAIDESAVVVSDPSEPVVLLVTGGDELSVRGATASVLKAALRARRFTASELVVPTLSTEQVLDQLRGLARAGVVTAVAR